MLTVAELVDAQNIATIQAGSPTVRFARGGNAFLVKLGGRLRASVAMRGSAGSSPAGEHSKISHLVAQRLEPPESPGERTTQQGGKPMSTSLEIVVICSECGEELEAEVTMEYWRSTIRVEVKPCACQQVE